MSSMYPKECYSCVRQQTFAVQPELFLADAEKGEDPAKIYGQFSRLQVTIIGKPDENNKRISVSSNVSIDALEEIKLLSVEAHEMSTNLKYSPTPAVGSCNATAEAGSSPAYTVPFTMGNLKGKTPAQVCIELGDAAKDVLNTQYKFLKANVAKYPANQKLMDAISDASKLMAAGKLSAVAAGAASVQEKPCIQLYSVMHGNPHKEHPQKKNYFYCHDTKIVWNIGNNYPVSVTIENYYAPIRADDLGKINVEVSNKLIDSVKKLEFKLTGAEWLHCLAMIEKTMSRFEIMHGKEIDNAISACDKANREAAKVASRSA